MYLGEDEYDCEPAVWMGLFREAVVEEVKLVVAVSRSLLPSDAVVGKAGAMGSLSTAVEREWNVDLLSAMDYAMTLSILGAPVISSAKGGMGRSYMPSC
jgi:hypothetical protein